MHLSGLQRCTLIDFPGKTACAVYTQGCNLRCPYCHNPGLIGRRSADPLPEASIHAFLDKRKKLIGAVVVSGGEPTEHADLDRFLMTLKERGLEVKLDTNGTRPEVLAALLEKGLVDYVAMDVKASPARYDKAAGVPVLLGAIQDSIDLLCEGRIGCHFRTTVVPGLHDPDEVECIARWVRKGPRYVLQGFIPDNALDPEYRQKAPASGPLLEACRQRAQRWIPTELA